MPKAPPEAMRTKEDPHVAIDKSALAWAPKNVWGPIKWRELHARAMANLPMEGEEKWFESFIQGLPCPKCRHHFEDFVRVHPPVFHSRMEFFIWTVEAHNAVNAATGKRSIGLGEAIEIHRFTPDQLPQ
jgi:Asfivirus FAD-linked sulfhydryl oxidase